MEALVFMVVCTLVFGLNLSAVPDNASDFPVVIESF
jgi:hypothetical protein